MTQIRLWLETHASIAIWLKVTELIDWPWVAVLMPLWIGIALVVVVALLKLNRGPPRLAP